MGDRDEAKAIREVLAANGSARRAAVVLGVSHRTLLRRMREYGIPVKKPGRPRVLFAQRYTRSNHNEMMTAEYRHWQALPVEGRISAVETIREQTILGYHPDSARLERVCRRARRTQGEVPRFGSQTVHVIGRAEYIKNKRESGKKPGRAKDLLDLELLAEGAPVSSESVRPLAEYGPSRVHQTKRKKK